jgi:predicted membrane channel-forming protein YqfA (hemolysin III family)
MTRGWLHIGIAAIATCAVASDGGRDALKIRHEKSLVTFFLVTFVFPYWASTLLHFVPWKRRVAHDVALVLDFLGIASGFAGQTVAWCGERWWALVERDSDHATISTNGKVTINPDRVAAVAAVAATCVLAYILTVAVLRRNRVPVMLHRRTARFAITGFNMLMLGIVETRNVRSVPLNVCLQLVGKIFVPGYFVRCVAVDATRKGPLPLWPGVWSAHENWHVVILILHVMQFYAISLKTHGEGFKWEWPE